MRQSLLSLRSRRVFAFVSNTQCNFDMIERVTGVGSTVKASELNALKGALDCVLRQSVPVCLVTNWDAFIEDAPPTYRACYIKQTVAHWSGEERAWRPVIRDFLSEGTIDRRP